MRLLGSSPCWKLLRHYAKQEFRSDMKLGRQRKSHKGQAAMRHYANQPMIVKLRIIFGNFRLKLYLLCSSAVLPLCVFNVGSKSKINDPDLRIVGEEERSPAHNPTTNWSDKETWTLSQTNIIVALVTIIINCLQSGCSLLGDRYEVRSPGQMQKIPINIYITTFKMFISF